MVQNKVLEYSFDDDLENSLQKDESLLDCSHYKHYLKDDISAQSISPYNRGDNTAPSTIAKIRLSFYDKISMDSTPSRKNSEVLHEEILLTDTMTPATTLRETRNVPM